MTGERCPCCLLVNEHGPVCPLRLDRRRRQVWTWVVLGLLFGVVAGYWLSSALGLIGPVTGGTP